MKKYVKNLANKIPALPAAGLKPLSRKWTVYVLSYTTIFQILIDNLNHLNPLMLGGNKKVRFT